MNKIKKIATGTGNRANSVNRGCTPSAISFTEKPMLVMAVSDCAITMPKVMRTAPTSLMA